MYCHSEENYKYIFMYAYTRVQQLTVRCLWQWIGFLRPVWCTYTYVIGRLKRFFSRSPQKFPLETCFGNYVTQILFRRYGYILRAIGGGPAGTGTVPTSLSVSSFHIHSYITDNIWTYQSAGSLSNTLKKLKLYVFIACNWKYGESNLVRKIN